MYATYDVEAEQLARTVHEFENLRDLEIWHLNEIGDEERVSSFLSFISFHIIGVKDRQRDVIENLVFEWATERAKWLMKQPIDNEPNYADYD